MDVRYLFFFIFILILLNCEGFTNIYQKNVNTEPEFPDSIQFYPVVNHNKIKLRNNKETYILGNNNYKLVDNSIQEPQKGSYSAFLDVNRFRNFDHFYHSPITDKTYGSDISYDRQFNYQIIQEEDPNKYELLQLEKENDQQIHNPMYLHGHPENNSKILYNDNIQEMFLKLKNKTNRYDDIGHEGSGYHSI